MNRRFDPNKHDRTSQAVRAIFLLAPASLGAGVLVLLLIWGLHATGVASQNVMTLVQIIGLCLILAGAFMTVLAGVLALPFASRVLHQRVKDARGPK